MIRNLNYKIQRFVYHCILLLPIFFILANLWLSIIKILILIFHKIGILYFYDLLMLNLTYLKSSNTLLENAFYFFSDSNENTDSLFGIGPAEDGSAIDQNGFFTINDLHCTKPVDDHWTNWAQEEDENKEYNCSLIYEPQSQHFLAQAREAVLHGTVGESILINNYIDGSDPDSQDESIREIEEAIQEVKEN
jgi:hypothetical protein